MKFLVAIHHPDGFDGSKEPVQVGLDIDNLNEEMEAAGARFFAGGLHPVSSSKSLRSQSDRKVLVTDGP